MFVEIAEVIEGKLGDSSKSEKFCDTFRAIAGASLGQCMDFNKCVLAGYSLIVGGSDRELAAEIYVNTMIVLSYEKEDEVSLSLDRACIVAENSFKLKPSRVSAEDMVGWLWEELSIESEIEKAEEGSEEDSEEDSEEWTNASSEIINSVINNIVSNIMGTYTRIYQPLFLNPPKGILYTKESGAKTIMCAGRSNDSQGVKVHDIPSISFFMSCIYEAILNQCPDIHEAPKVGSDGMSIKGSWINEDGTMLYNYLPYVQVRNCMGIYRDKESGLLKRASTWSEFSSKLGEELKPMILELLKKVDVTNSGILKTAIESIQELYTTIILVNEFDAEKAMRLTIYNTSSSMRGAFKGIAGSIIQSNPLSKSLDEYTVVGDNEQAGVKELLIVTNKDKYCGEINFAYKTLGKIINAGGSIDLKHTVVGTRLNGKPFEINLANSSYTSIAIMAGSGSGKGVLTLALLAAMVAAGCPIVYLDYKPDMAGAFWDLERELGVPVLAVDGLNHRTADASPVRAYNAGYGVPDELSEVVVPELGAIAYVKGVQLMNLLGGAKLNGSMPKDKKTFFVLDEAEKCGASVNQATLNIEEIMKRYKPRGKDEPSPIYLYLKKLHSLYSTVGKSADEFLKTNARSGNMGALTIGQSAYVTAWNGPFKSMAVQSAVKFLGTGSEKGGAGIDKRVDGIEMMGMGYFGFVNGAESSKENTTMIKTSMVLNAADFDASTRTGGTYTGSLLHNITNESVKESIINDDMIVSPSNDIALSAGLQVGEANTLVGFAGLVEYIGRNSGNFNIRESISAGYKEVEFLLTKLGILGEDGHYDNVEAYMYSAKEDSLFSFAQLSSALSSNQSIYDYLENGAVVSELMGDNPQEDGSDGDDLINIMGSNLEDYSDMEAQSIRTDAEMKQVFGDTSDYSESEELTDFDIFAEPTKEEIPLADTSTPKEVLDKTGEKQAIIDELVRRLVEMGVNVNIPYEEPEQFNSTEETNFSQRIDIDDSVESYQKLIDIVSKNLIEKFGGYENIKSFKVVGGSIVVNGYYYRCKVSDLFAKGIPYDVRRDMNAGNVCRLFNYSLLRNMRYLRDLEFDSISFTYDYVSPALGYGSNISVDLFFRDFRALKSLQIGKKKFARSTYMEQIKGDDTFYQPRTATKMADASEKILCSGTSKTWQFTRNSFSSKKYGKAMKVLAVGGGVAATVAVGGGALAVKGGRKLLKGISAVGRGLKDMIDESSKF